MAKKTVRQIEAELASTVEDQVLQDLGYREYAVTVPDFGLVEPRPEVKQINLAGASTNQLNVYVSELGNNRLPVAVYRVLLPRLVPESAIKSKRLWLLKHDSWQNPTEVKAVAIARQDSRWQVDLAVVKTQA